VGLPHIPFNYDKSKTREDKFSTTLTLASMMDRKKEEKIIDKLLGEKREGCYNS